MLDAATWERFGHNRGHTASYYRGEKHRRNKEVFANIVASLGSDTKFCTKVLEKIAPALKKAPVKLLKQLQ